MRVAATFSFNGGREAVERLYPELLEEVKRAVTNIDAEDYRDKESKEKTKKGRMLFSPVRLNKAFKRELLPNGWAPLRVKCEYSTGYYEEGYTPKALGRGAFREMDFIKKKLGVEVQFGKYSFMVYNVSAKMTIFHNLGHIDTGIEIVPVKAFSLQMSSGVSYFEQFVWDLERRGISNIDIPVLILGIDK